MTGALFACWALAGCGGTSKAPPEPPACEPHWPTRCVSGAYCPATTVTAAAPPDLSFYERRRPPGPRSRDARHVSPDAGDDINSGRHGAPWKTLTHAMAKLMPGQACYVHAHPSGQPHRERIETQRAGRPDAPIWLIGEPGAVIGADHAVHQTSLRVRHAYWGVRDLEFSGEWAVGVPFTGAAVAVDGPNAHHVVLQNVDAHDCADYAIISIEQQAHDVALLDCRIHDSRLWQPTSGGRRQETPAILISTGATKVLVRGCTSGNNAGDAVQGQNAETTDVTIEGNDFSGDKENAVDIKSCQLVTIRGNRFHDYRPIFNDDPPVDPPPADPPLNSPQGAAVVLHESADGVLVEGNEIWDCGMAVAIGAANGDMGAAVVRRNLIYDVRASADPLFGETGSAINVQRATTVEIYHNTLRNLGKAPPGLEFVSRPGYALAAGRHQPAGQVLRVGRLLFFNNIVVGTGTPLRLNLTAGPGGLPFVEAFASGANVFHDVAAPLADAGSGAYHTLADWQALGYDCGSEDGDPLLRNPPVDFGTRRGSPARDAGVWVTLPGAGPAVRGKAPDIGRVESRGP
jgi:hypothetical protein